MDIGYCFKNLNINCYFNHKVQIKVNLLKFFFSKTRIVFFYLIKLFLCLIVIHYSDFLHRSNTQ